MKFCLLILVFQLFIKQLNALSLPTIITDNTNLVSTNQCCLFNQSRDVYDSDTAVLHWFISKRDKVNVLLSTFFNQYCLFNQSRDVYDSDTAVLHWIISKSDKVNVLFCLKPFPSAFQGLFSTFIIFFCDFSEL